MTSCFQAAAESVEHPRRHSISRDEGSDWIGAKNKTNRSNGTTIATQKLEARGAGRDQRNTPRVREDGTTAIGHGLSQAQPAISFHSFRCFASTISISTFSQTPYALGDPPDAVDGPVRSGICSKSRQPVPSVNGAAPPWILWILLGPPAISPKSPKCLLAALSIAVSPNYVEH